MVHAKGRSDMEQSGRRRWWRRPNHCTFQCHEGAAGRRGRVHRRRYWHGHRIRTLFVALMRQNEPVLVVFQGAQEWTSMRPVWHPKIGWSYEFTSFSFERSLEPSGTKRTWCAVGRRRRIDTFRAGAYEGNEEKAGDGCRSGDAVRGQLKLPPVSHVHKESAQERSERKDEHREEDASSPGHGNAAHGIPWCFPTLPFDVQRGQLAFRSSC